MMTPSSSLPLAGAGLDTSEGRSFVRGRLALLGKTLALLTLGFFAVLFALYLILGNMPALDYLARRRTLVQLAGAAVMGGLWLVTRRHEASLQALGTIDAAALVLCCVCWSTLVDAGVETPYIALLASSLTVVARAVIVPSSARRTLLLSATAMAGTLVATMLVRPSLIVGVTVSVWIGAAVGVAAVASSVIYGLRQRVKEATDLGAYTLEEKIGSGGMGEVWRAHHRLLIRPAAVKVIRPRVQGSAPGHPEVLSRRFEREARATAALRSPHTVELYDFGVAGDGSLYYVMELLEGFNLQQLVERFGPQPAERVVHLLHQVCCSLADAHHNGLIHRDIKPANIFVTRSSGAADFVKVVDFGLVKLARPPEGRAAGLTGTGCTTGTPAYMAPEAAGADGKLDGRTDLYSLGCVAYWLLTGKLVFEGNSISVLIDHARTPPPPPSTRVELAIPPAVEQLVLECLEKDPSRRPESAAALAARLESLVLPTRWTQERAESWWRTHARDIGERRAAADLLLSMETQRRRTLAYDAEARS